MTDERIHGLVGHLFRREAGKLVATLTRSFGPRHLDLAEEVVQEALVQALKRWSYDGVPQNPGGWLYRVARNLAVDRLRRDTTFSDKETAIRRLLEERQAEDPGDVAYGGELTDDQLRLIFLCCHPDLPRDARVALTLKAVGGFSVAEIARAFLTQEPTVAQRLVRAQKRIRERSIPFEVPGPSELPERLEAVLEGIYLIFNEGYAAHEGDALVRSDLVEEALRLASQLARLPATDRPEVHALAALLFFQASRVPARLNADGELVLLQDQDRSLWDRRRIAQGFLHLERSAEGEAMSVYHLQAAIAAQHAAAPSDDETDWAFILARYDELYALQPSPIVALNRAVAVARCRGPAAGLDALEEIADHPKMAGYYLYPATRAELLVRAGEREEAADAYRLALECPSSGPERRFLEKKLAAL